MKKLLISLLTLLTLSAIADSSHADVSAFKAYASDANTSQSITYDSTFLDYDPTANLSAASVDVITDDDIASSNAAKQNDYLTMNHLLIGHSSSELLNSTFAMFENINLIANDDQSLYYANIGEIDGTTTYFSMYYNQMNPNIYFDLNYSGNINFYILPIGRMNLTHSEYFEAFNNLLTHSYEIPLLTINEKVYFSIVFNGNGKGFHYKTSNNASVLMESMANMGDFAPDLADKYNVIKVSIPYIKEITAISALQIATCENSVFGPGQPSSRFYYWWHSSMHDLYYIHKFGIHSISISDSTIVIDKRSYIQKDNSWGYDILAYPNYIKFEYIETIKTYITGSDGKTTIKTDKNDPEIRTYNFLPDDTTESGNYITWHFEPFEKDEHASGSLKILEIGWNSYYIDSSNQMIIDEDNLYIQDSSNISLNKYSFSSDKSIRVYTYNWAGYKRSYYTNNRGFWDYLFAGPAQYLLDDRYLYQCYGFNFFFDEAKTLPINNVKKIALKWQCGYEAPNPEIESDGWYPDVEDESKNVKIAVKEVDANKKLLNYALDDDGMFVSSDTDEELMTDPDGVKYDYIVCKKFTKGDLNTYITQMAPLEIYYEAESMDLIKLVGNSQGLHVEQDNDGEYRVYNVDGILVDEYGVYEAPDGYYYPAIDTNGDGIYTADETVDTDTGEGRQYFDDPLAEQSALDKFLDWWESLTNSIKNFNWDRLFTIVILFVIAIIFGPSLIDWVKKLFSKK